MTNRLRMTLILLLAVSVSGSYLPATAEEAPGYRIETYIDCLRHPYSIAFLPDGGALITEKAGRLRLFANGRLSPEPAAVLPAVYDKNQGGLTDVVLHPRFADNQLVYLAGSTGDDNANRTTVLRGRLEGHRLTDVETVFRAQPPKDTTVHFGARLAFLKDGTLLISVGDGGQYREKAQDLSSMLGSIIRIRDDGSVPDDNPFVDRSGALPEIWSYGHRNPQGLMVDNVTGEAYATEHGPRGGDELDHIEPGNNYGWPLATYGVDYTGARITPFKEYPGTIQPLVQWTPSLAPSGLDRCRGCLWPEWEGDFFAGMLMGRQVQRVSFKDGKSHRESLFEEPGERIRDVTFGPDGALYLVTDNVQGRVLRVTPRSHRDTTR